MTLINYNYFMQRGFLKKSNSKHFLTFIALFVIGGFFLYYQNTILYKLSQAKDIKHFTDNLISVQADPQHTWCLYENDCNEAILVYCKDPGATAYRVVNARINSPRGFEGTTNAEGATILAHYVREDCFNENKNDPPRCPASLFSVQLPAGTLPNGAPYSQMQGPTEGTITDAPTTGFYGDYAGWRALKYTNCAHAPICHQYTCNTTNLLCPTGLACQNGTCVNPSCPSDADCACPAPSCYQNTCNTTTLPCPSGLACQNGSCVNANCPSSTSCKCEYACEQITGKAPATGTQTGNVPTRGQTFSMTCDGSGMVASTANFRVVRILNNNDVQETGIGAQGVVLDANKLGTWNNNNQPLAVDFAAGTYKFQCQICNSVNNQCTTWGKGEVKQL